MVNELIKKANYQIYDKNDFFFIAWQKNDDNKKGKIYFTSDKYNYEYYRLKIEEFSLDEFIIFILSKYENKIYSFTCYYSYEF